ncbi:MAG: hypothetical protein NVS1B7_6880 [Candidatus Saccharimonadales bacterium]
MGQALYRKHRPKSLSEVVGQEHITTTLDNALKQGRISHAYLFTGPRGIGKTSIARILAHEVNHIPYDETITHMDIIEIDAASNRRIDEIRELRERVHTAPTSAKYKVYIIDEVHMLTKEAFNALLKTLEEPPAHVIFILATTESHKLPETIVSRTQRFNFKPVNEHQVVTHLAAIAKQEKIHISPEALALIAQHGEGSFRDSISLLDQAGSSGAKVELSEIQRMLGIAPEQTITELVDIIKSGTTVQLVDMLGYCREKGLQPAQLAKQLAAKLRQLLLENTLPFSASKLSQLLHELLLVPASHDPAAALELALIDQVIERIPVTVSAPDQAAQYSERKKPSTVKQKQSPQLPSSSQTVINDVATVVATPLVAHYQALETEPTAASSANWGDQTWNEVLNQIKKTHNTLYGIARMAVPYMTDDTLTLSFSFPFHQKRINEAKNKLIISDVITALTGSSVTIICVMEKDAPAQAIAKIEPIAEVTHQINEPENSTIDTISNIFGGAEILE